MLACRIVGSLKFRWNIADIWTAVTLWRTVVRQFFCGRCKGDISRFKSTLISVVKEISQSPCRREFAKLLKEKYLRFSNWYSV